MSLFSLFSSASFNNFRGRGQVSQTIKPLYPGRVYFRGTYWPAQLADDQSRVIAHPGDLVEVLGREGLTLIVKPLSPQHLQTIAASLMIILSSMGCTSLEEIVSTTSTAPDVHIATGADVIITADEATDQLPPSPVSSPSGHCPEALLSLSAQSPSDPVLLNFEQSSSAVIFLPVPDEVLRRERLMTCVRELDINRAWLSKTVDELLYQAHPELKSRVLRADSADLVWRLEWLAIAEQMLLDLARYSPDIRQTLGAYRPAHYDRWTLTDGLVSLKTVSALADLRLHSLFPHYRQQSVPPETIGQVWYALMHQSVQGMQAGIGFEVIDQDWRRSQGQFSTPAQVASQSCRLDGCQLVRSRALLPHQGDIYEIWLDSRQYLTFMTKSVPQAELTMLSPSGEPLLKLGNPWNWSGRLSSSGYYKILIVSTASDPVTYQLEMAVTESQR